MNDSQSKKYYGKYRGTVINNVDPMQIGRILAMVPDVSSLLPTSWAMPCLPVAGKQSGTYFVPQMGAGVWIEFEQGNPDHPIWVGSFWGIVAEVPTLALLGNPASPSMMMQTTAQHTVLLSDGPTPPLAAGGILLKSGVSMITIGPDGVKIVAPKIEINGIMLVNNGALTVTL